MNPFTKPAANASLHGQDTELRLLLRALDVIDHRTAVDVGAEKGTFVDALLRHPKCEGVWAFEPYPPHAQFLEQKYRHEPRVKVFPIALGAVEEERALNLAQDAEGQDLDYYHSLERFQDTPQVRWGRSVPVRCRTLGSLVESEDVPPRIGILKIDTEGHDFAVVRGLGGLHADVVMVEFWVRLSETVGELPWSLEEMAALMRSRRYRDLVMIKRHDEFELLQVNSLARRDGDWGNLLFVHENVAERLMPIIAEEAAASLTRAVDKGLGFRAEAHERAAQVELLCEGRPLVQLLRRLRRRKWLGWPLRVLLDPNRETEATRGPSR